MIFKTITLHNLFSYYGTTTFDLMPPTDKAGNIVIIMGRNGFGKTSFLNSIKLLFGGATKDLRHGVQRGNSFPEKSFVLGAKEWWGILNRQAKNNDELDCFVSAVLVDKNNQEIFVKRSWNLRDDNYQNQIEVTAPRKAPLVSDNAQQFLSSLLPLDYIPFFFFDAEEIGYMAEANSNQLIEKMEQLLNIRPVDNLNSCIGELRKKIERESITQDVNLALVRAENRQEELLIEQQNLNEQCQTVGFDIELLDNELREIKQKIRLFSGQGAIENNAKLEAEKHAELKNQEEALTNLSEVFERDGFLRLNAKPVQNAMSVVDRCAHGLRSASSEMLESLRDPLKEIFTTPPYLNNQRLSDAQIKFYQNRIIKLLDSRDIEDEDNSPFKLDTWRAKKLLSQLLVYTHQHAPETPIRDALLRAVRAERAVNNIDKTLQEVSLLSEESKLQLEQLHDKQEQQQDIQNKYKNEEREINNRLANIEREINALGDQIAGLKKQVRQSEQGRLRIDLLDKMLKLLATYRQQLKHRQRGVLENQFNKHLHSLLDSNRLIDKAKIDEYFQLQYLDKNENTVAMSSISAGMKQLSATALLWALKDACGKQLPVIIDTPLGRIDKQHQDNLLNRYYPHAAMQVILLPTDSELDERKRQLLAPYIYREYQLHNEDGNNTHIELMPSSQGVNNG